VLKFSFLVIDVIALSII